MLNGPSENDLKFLVSSGTGELGNRISVTSLRRLFGMLSIVLLIHSASLIECPYIGHCLGTGKAKASMAGHGLQSEGPWFGRKTNLRAGVWRLLIKTRSQGPVASGGHGRKCGISTTGEEGERSTRQPDVVAHAFNQDSGGRDRQITLSSKLACSTQ